MNNTLTSAAANLKNLENQRAAVAAKDESGSTTQIELHGQHVEAGTTLNNLERLHILDQATAAEVETAQRRVDDLAAKLAATERRNKLIKEELQKIDAEILKTKQEIAAAQRQLCAELRNEAIAKIKTDKTLRQNLVAAMVANVGTGGSYTFSATVFVTQFVHQLLPQISEAEVREAAEKFKRDNGL